MKKKSLLLVLLMSSSQLIAQIDLFELLNYAPRIRSSHRGIWLYDGSNASLNDENVILPNLLNQQLLLQQLDDETGYTHSSVKGVLLCLSWNKYEISKNVFDDSYVNDAINNVIEKNPKLSIGIMMWTGKHCPSWLFDAGIINPVKKFKTFEGPASQRTIEGIYPDYLEKENHLNYWLMGTNSSLSSKYETHWRNMISHLINQINNYTGVVQVNGINYNYRKNILFLQSAEGTTGDLNPYHGTIQLGDDANFDGVPDSDDLDYIIAGDDWKRFVARCYYYTASLLVNANNLINIHFLVNSGEPTQIWNDLNNNPTTTYLSTVPSSSLFYWISHSNEIENYLDPIICNYLKTTWRKSTNEGHWFQLNYDHYFKKAFDDLQTQINLDPDPVVKKSEIITRDEFGILQVSNLDIIKPYNLFALATSALDFGMDMWMVHYQLLFDPVNHNLLLDNQKVFDFFNNMQLVSEPVSNPQIINFAFCSFRDGLDASDFTRHNASGIQLGSGCTQNLTTPAYQSGNIPNCGGLWCDNIADFYSSISNPKGALVEDNINCQGGPNHQIRDANGTGAIIDVNWYGNNYSTENGNIVSYGNYEKFLHQEKANTSTEGYWNQKVLNPLTQNGRIYGRFCRALSGVNSNGFANKIMLKINPNFGANFESMAQSSELIIAVTYLNDPTAGGNGDWTLYKGSGFTFPDFTIHHVNTDANKEWKTVYFSLGSTSESSFIIKNSNTTYKNYFALVQVILIPVVTVSPGTVYFDPGNFPQSGPLEKKPQKKLFLNNDNSYNTVNTSLGEETKLTRQQIKLYPNPANQVVNLEFESNGSSVENLMISNIAGNAVQTMRINILQGMNKTSIPVNHLAAGEYFIRFMVDGEQQQLRLTIQR